jgi:tRNA A-37 threonylcarbamoyl transferase component Bud32
MSEAVEGRPAVRSLFQVMRHPWSLGADPPSVEEQLPKPGTEVGGYRVEAKLGAGSFGTVFRARRGDNAYAIKFLYLPLAAEWAWRELEVLLRLRRSGVVAVEGHGQWPDEAPRFLYLVLPYVRGRSLEDWAQALNPSARQVATMVASLARQLAVVHRAGVVHRDVKGTNVLVREADGQPVLVDFGVGTYAGAPKVTHPIMPPGTALYRSPEIIRFRRELAGLELYQSIPSDDLWALGVLLYWLLTGNYPFEGRDPGSLANAILRSAPEVPHVRNPRVPRALGEVCLRMLEKAREARYPDGDAAAEALESVLAEADPAWDVPLCDAWGPDSVTTPLEGYLCMEDGLDRLDRLEEYARRRPRRGAPVPLEEEAPAAPEPPRTRVRPWRAVAWAALALGMVLGALALFASARSESVSAASPSTTSPVVARGLTPEVIFSGQEVARAWCPLDGDEGAAPVWAPTPAPVASATQLEDSRMNTPPKTPSSRRETQPLKDSRTRTVKAGALAVCTALSGCAGSTAQLRSAPPPESCPHGALEAMQTLGIRTGSQVLSTFQGNANVIVVYDGPGSIDLGFDLGMLPAGTVLSGTLFVGAERVYGRFTQAHVPGGKSWPVCIEAVDNIDGKRGALRLSKEGPGAKVGLGVNVRAVERFE